MVIREGPFQRKIAFFSGPAVGLLFPIFLREMAQDGELSGAFSPLWVGAAGGCPREIKNWLKKMEK
jgi:hypothetical protein